jgi:peptidoglycan hydrolase CwlO-like protein
MKTTIMKSISGPSKIILGLLVTASFLANPALAADKKDKASRRAQQMVQQIQQEKAQLQSQLDQVMQAKALLDADMAKAQEENTSLKTKLGAANRKIDGLEISLKEMTAERLAFEAKLLKTQTELEATKTALNELDVKYQANLYDLKVNEKQRANLTATTIQKTKVIDACLAKNAKLYDYGLELVKLYENPSLYKQVVLTEKFSQLKRVELENILQNYNDKIDLEKATCFQ